MKDLQIKPVFSKKAAWLTIGLIWGFYGIGLGGLAYMDHLGRLHTDGWPKAFAMTFAFVGVPVFIMLHLGVWTLYRWSNKTPSGRSSIGWGVVTLILLYVVVRACQPTEPQRIVSSTDKLN